MSKLSISLLILITAVYCYSNPMHDDGFIYLGSFRTVGRSALAECSSYYLSNAIDSRSVADARTGCHDGWKEGAELVALETPAEHTNVRFLLSTNGITDANRIWTTGQFVSQSLGWNWYNYASGNLTPISNAGNEPWVGGVVPDSGCLSIGGRDFTYGWQALDCETRRRYLCETSVTCGET